MGGDLPKAHEQCMYFLLLLLKKNKNKNKKQNNLSLSVKTTQINSIIALAVKKSEMNLAWLQSRCLLETVRDNLFFCFFNHQLIEVGAFLGSHHSDLCFLSCLVSL